MVGTKVRRVVVGCAVTCLAVVLPGGGRQISGAAEGPPEGFSAAFVGPLVPGEVERLAARWAGQGPVSLPARVDLDGDGEALYVGGYPPPGGTGPTYLSRWNGTSWTSIGDELRIGALAVFDDGTGPTLFVGGILPDGSHLAKWDASGWSPMYGLLTQTLTPTLSVALRRMPGHLDLRLIYTYTQS